MPEIHTALLPSVRHNLMLRRLYTCVGRRQPEESNATFRTHLRLLRLVTREEQARCSTRCNAWAIQCNTLMAYYAFKLMRYGSDEKARTPCRPAL